MNPAANIPPAAILNPKIPVMIPKNPNTNQINRNTIRQIAPVIMSIPRKAPMVLATPIDLMISIISLMSNALENESP